MGMKGAWLGVCRNTIEGPGVAGSGDIVRGAGSIGLKKMVGDIGNKGAGDEGNMGMGMRTLQYGGTLAMSSENSESR